jgi:UDP-N-acetylglucosamine 2-epimerase (non-hydrolysing)
MQSRFGADHFLLVTLHRPNNVDDADALTELMAALNELAANLRVIFPVHPRTRERIARTDLSPALGLSLVEPVGYLDFLALQLHATAVLTDSGGIQEETTYLGIPCLTARPNTERPVTITLGTNRLVRRNREAITAAVRAALNGDQSPRRTLPELWDGNAAARTVEIFRRL